MSSRVNNRFCPKLPAESQPQSMLLADLLLRSRKLVERFFNKINWYRRIATHYDKLAANYLAFVKPSAMRISMAKIVLTMCTQMRNEIWRQREFAMEDAAQERPRVRTRSRRIRSEANIHIRATIQIKHLIDTAATAVGKTLSEFVLDSMRQRAIDVLLDQRLFVLDPDKYDAFVRALDNPPPAGPKLRALMKRKPLWQK